MRSGALRRRLSKRTPRSRMRWCLGRSRCRGASLSAEEAGAAVRRTFPPCEPDERGARSQSGPTGRTARGQIEPTWGGRRKAECEWRVVVRSASRHVTVLTVLSTGDCALRRRGGGREHKSPNFRRQLGRSRPTTRAAPRRSRVEQLGSHIPMPLARAPRVFVCAHLVLISRFPPHRLTPLLPCPALAGPEGSASLSHSSSPKKPARRSPLPRRRALALRCLGCRTAGHARGAEAAVCSATPHPKLPGTIYTAAEAIEEAGGTALPLVVDIRQADQVEQARRSLTGACSDAVLI